MKDSTRTIRKLTLGTLAFAFALCGAASASAQEASTTYKGVSRDPFSKYKPPVKRKASKKVVEPVAPPSLQSRIEQYKADKAAAMNRQQAAPKPTTALLLGELQVTGIFRTPRGFAAMVEATPIKLSYVIYPGEPFFDGMLVAIEETRLVFRRQTRWTDGRVEVAVESKPLRQPSAGDALTATKAAAPASSETPAAADASGKDEKSEIEKLKAEVERLKALAQSAGARQEAGRP
jgi:hypothetical protein